MNNDLLIHKKKNISEFTVILLCIFVFVSISGYGRITNYISAILVLPVIFLCLNEIFIKKDKKITAFFCFFVFYAITSLINFSSLYYLFGTCIFGTLINFSPLFIEYYVKQFSYSKRKKKFFFLLCIIWFLIVIVSCFTYAKATTGGRTYIREHTGLLLGGGYSASYGSAILSVVLFCYLKSMYSSLKPRTRLFLILGITLSVAHVILTVSMITTISMIAGLISVLIFCRKKNKKSGIGQTIYVVILAIIVFVFIYNSKEIGSYFLKLSSEINQEQYANRIRDIGLFLFDNTESHHFADRSDTLIKSWNLFLKSPVIGSGYLVGNDFSMLKNLGLGTHSEFLDSFAQFGVMGAIPFVYIYIKSIRESITKSSVAIDFPFIITFFILFIFNPFLSTQTSFILFLFIPQFQEFIENEY